LIAFYYSKERNRGNTLSYIASDRHGSDNRSLLSNALTTLYL
jgi:hypothetical protein